MIDFLAVKQSVENDHMNISCMGGRTVGWEVAWDLVETYLAAECSQANGTSADSAKSRH